MDLFCSEESDTQDEAKIEGQLLVELHELHSHEDLPMRKQNLTTSILLVEDDEDDFILLRDVLSGISTRDFDLHWVMDFNLALEALSDDSYDVCLLDYRLGNHNGLDVLKAIRPKSDIPFIFLTGQGDYELDLEIMQAGADDYLTKDQLNTTTLERSIRYVLERKQKKEQLLKAEKVIQALSECNHAVIHLKDEVELLREICRIIVEVGGYRMAWVGYAEHDEAKTVLPIAKFGCDENYVESLGIVWADVERGRGPTGVTIRTGTPYVCNDILENPHFAPWREDALKRGYASSVVFPLRIEASVFGALNIYAQESGAFRGREFELLQQMANDLTFGINTLRSQQKMKQLATAVEKSSDWILITDKAGRIEYVNNAVGHITGYKKEEVLGKTPRIFKSGRYDEAFYRQMWETLLSGTTFVGILTNRRKDGELFEIFHTVTPLSDYNGEITHFVATSKDITEHKQLEQRINYLAYYDELTGLPNRSLFTDRVKQAIARGEHHGQSVGVLFLDIDRFHLINDVLGSGIGDMLLKETGRRLSEYVREGDTVARLGNDEYAILFNDMARPEDVIFLLQELTEVLSMPITTGGEHTVLTFSVGVSIYPDDTTDAEALLRNSDMACQRAKQGGGNTYLFFTAAMNTAASEFVVMERRLKSGLLHNEFILHYQPYWDVHTRKMVGMEALIRWQTREEGLIPPGKFIPVLEETGMIVEVGEWVFRTAIRQIREWLDRGYSVVPISVNLSLIQFRQKNLAATIKKILEECGVSPTLLIAEITESAFMEDLEYTGSTLRELRAAGLSVSIDDFGTGYSSLSYLRKLPVDNLKIDISFIRELGQDTDAEKIVSAIVTMARALNLKAIAEGVETEQQMQLLRFFGCDTVQGFYLSRPLPVQELEKLL